MNRIAIPPQPSRAIAAALPLGSVAVERIVHKRENPSPLRKRA
jgi:hypothetical protein